MTSRALIGTLLLLGLGGGSLGGSPVGRPAPPSTPLPAATPPAGGTPLPAALHDAVSHLPQEARPVSPGVWRIQNRRYRATFSAADGVRFAPGTATAYDEANAWTFRARTASLGSRRTTLARVAPSISGHIVEFRRPGLVERYVGGRDGVEQLFILTERPAAPGSIRISGAIDVTAKPDGRGGLTFHHANGRLTHYSPPMAFDATGRALDVRAESGPGHLDLVVDGAQLATATFPVTIDPVISAPAIVASADNVTWHDVAFNWRRGEFLVVFGRDEPGEDPSVHLRRYRADGQPIGAVAALAVAGGWNWKPKVAYNLPADRYLVVWEQSTGPDDWTATVRGLLLDSTATPIGADFAVNDGPGSRASEPDVAARNFAGTAAPGEAAWMVTWRQWTDGGDTLDVMAERIDATGVELGEAQLNDDPVFHIPALLAPNDDVSEAAIAFSPHVDRFLVVWRNLPEVRGRTVSAAGGLGVDFAVSEGAVHPQLPALDYDMGSRRFLATWSDGAGIRGDLLTAAALPAELGDFQITGDGAHSAIAAEPGGFDVLYSRDQGGDLDVVHAYVSAGGQTWELGALTVDATHDDYLAASTRGQQAFHVGTWRAIQGGADDRLMRSVFFGRFAHFVHGSSGDFGGTPGSDLFLFRQGGSQWHIRTSVGDTVVNQGQPGDLPVLMDVDGDTRADVGTWRPFDGTFRVRVTATGIVLTTPWGQAGDIPVPGDYTGDGIDDYAVFRQTTGSWLIADSVTGASRTITWGQRGDVPTPADYDGDGSCDLGVWRPATGTWHLRNVAGTFTTAVPFGAPGDVPLQGNFVGSIHADQVFFRPSTGRWHRRDGQTGAVTIVPWGLSGDIPMPLDRDADGLLDLAVYRSTTGTWRILDANGVWSTVVAFGIAGDLPAGAR